MLKLAPAIEIKEVKNYDGHIYDLDEGAEQFLPIFYKEPGFRVMYNEEMKRLYVQKFEEMEKKENE